MHDPKRLIVSEDNELGVALAVARRQLPDSERLALLAEQLARHGVSLSTDFPGPVPKAPASRGLGLKLKIALGVTSVAVLGLVGVASRPRPSVAPRATQAVASAQVSTEVSSSPVAAAAAPPSEPARRAPRVAAPAVELAPSMGVASAQPQAPSAAAPAPTQASPRAPSRGRPTSSEPAQPGASGTVYQTPSGAELPTTELELVKQARNAVTADPARAYALTERSRAQFPSGAFAQERDFIALSALFRLGREQQARSQASVFRSRYPRSAYLPQIQRMLGEP